MGTVARFEKPFSQAWVGVEMPRDVGGVAAERGVSRLRERDAEWKETALS